jgi:hypothetical protein
MIEVIEVKPADSRGETEIQLHEVIGKIVKGSPWRPKGDEAGSSAEGRGLGQRERLDLFQAHRAPVSERCASHY